MGLFSRNSTSGDVDMEVARQAAEAVNRGDLDEADRIVNATGDPTAHAAAAFRYFDTED